MKSNKLASLIVVALFATVAIPGRLAAQDQQDQHATHPHYRLIDLGSLGGPVSYINPAYTFGSHNQTNLEGTVVGGAATSIPTTLVSNSFVCGGLDGTVPFVNHAFKWRAGVLNDLGALSGPENCSVATSVNARGEIVGRSENGLIDPAIGANQVRAVLWNDGEITDLGTLGGVGSSANAINNRGQVVGFSFNAILDPLSLIYFGLAGSSQGTQTRAFLWEDGVMQDLGTLGGTDALALFVNERGQVAGFSYTDSRPNPVTGLPTTHPFIWDKEKGMIDLGGLGGTLAGPVTPVLKPTSETGGFSNRGQFVGIATLPGDQTVHPFLWDGEKLIDLFTETAGGNPVSAAALNDAGEVVGGAVFPNRTIGAYLWKNGIALDLGTVEGDGCSLARAINSRGQVVGQSFACDGSTLHAFLWENGSIVDLNKLIPRNSELQLVDPLSINDRGEIVGIGLPRGCTLAMGDATCGHAFALVPCDEEHSEIESCAATETTITATQSALAPTNLSPKNVVEGPTPREIAAPLQAQFGRNRSFGTWPRK
jgi:probable HAF family extracellular repeat protein